MKKHKKNRENAKLDIILHKTIKIEWGVQENVEVFEGFEGISK